MKQAHPYRKKERRSKRTHLYSRSIIRSEEENSAGSESDLPVTQVKMSTPFDTKLKHLLNNYFYAKNDKHDIWQALVENDILTYDRCSLIVRHLKA